MAKKKKITTREIVELVEAYSQQLEADTIEVRVGEFFAVVEASIDKDD